MTNRIFALAAALAVFLPTAAQADTASVKVAVADLDLGTAKDQRRLDSRIDGAVRTICNTRGSRSVAAIRETLSCTAMARTSVTKQIDRALARAQSDGTRLAAVSVVNGG